MDYLLKVSIFQRYKDKRQNILIKQQNLLKTHHQARSEGDTNESRPLSGTNGSISESNRLHRITEYKDGWQEHRDTNDQFIDDETFEIPQDPKEQYKSVRRLPSDIAAHNNSYISINNNRESGTTDADKSRMSQSLRGSVVVNRNEREGV